MYKQTKSEVFLALKLDEDPLYRHCKKVGTARFLVLYHMVTKPEKQTLYLIYRIGGGKLRL